MDGKQPGKDEKAKDRGSRGGPVESDETHTEAGAPTDKAHRDSGDGALTGSVPAGLTPEQLKKVAEEDRDVEPGTG